MKKSNVLSWLLCLSSVLTFVTCRREIRTVKDVNPLFGEKISLNSNQKAEPSICWLEAKNAQIVSSSSGAPIRLRTINLGGWLIQEGYMLNPQRCADCPGTQWQMKKKYHDQGKTDAEITSFYQSWRDNFITKADIDYIASLGFNSVRLPMHYELFLTAAQRLVRDNVAYATSTTEMGNRHDAYKNALQSWYNSNQLFNDESVEGFRIIDNLLGWCAANNMYVILDLHAAPGGQGADANIADCFYANNLWQFQLFQDVTDLLWQRISQRYMHEPRIAFYDLLNEPNQVPGGGQTIHTLLQRIIETIRNNGDKHMLLVEGNGFGNNYDYLEPNTFPLNSGLIYNAHRYGITPLDDNLRDANPNQINRLVNLTEFRTRYNVPVWVGETGENSNDWLRQNIVKLDQNSIGWAHWTYKRFDVSGNAALMRIGGHYPTDGVNVMNEVLESIKFQNCIRNSSTIQAVVADLPAPGTSICNSSVTKVPIGMKIWFKSTANKYVSSENGLTNMTCNRPVAGAWEQFTVVDGGDGKIALKGTNDRYVSSENGVSAITCNRITIGAWERFEWIDLGSGQIAFKGSNNRYISSENGVNSMTCDRSSIGGWETFSWGQ